ncbi:MAG TPA: peptidase S14 [Croceibacterium sp.]|nr:peptidase S14 [Croceibacterium sp.]
MKMARDNPGAETPGAALPRECVLNPQVRLIGPVCDDMLRLMLDRLAKLTGDEEIVAIEISTLGGDAEIGRRMVLEMDLVRERLPKCRFVFVGKSAVYSAGTTLMSGFPVRDRFLTAEATLLIHCRQLEKTVELSGPIRSSLPLVEALCHQIKTGIALEMEHFERLIEGSDVTLDELLEKALYNWYLPARDALKRGLIAGIV